MELIKVKNRPLNDEVKEALYNYINTLDVETNNKLPREEVLAEMIGVSRITIRRVLAELSQEGIVFRKHGKGTFVNAEVLQIKVTFNPAQEFEKMIIKSGYKAKVELVNVEIKPAGNKIAQKLQIEPGDEIVIVEKIFYADDNPAIFCIDRFPRKLIQSEIVHNEMKENVFDYLKRKTGRKVVRDIVEITTTISTKNDNLKTSINYKEAKSLLVFDSVNFDQNNMPIVYDTEYYDTDYIKFNSHRQKEV